MNSVTIQLTDDDKESVREMLVKLFTFQDRPASEKKIEMFIEDISTYGFPFPAIIEGIRSMFNEDFRTVKLFNILEAIRAKIIPEEHNFEDCKRCNRTGFISMLDEKKYSFCFACTCDRGRRYEETMKLVRWNRQKIQYIKTKKFTLHDSCQIEG